MGSGVGDFGWRACRGPRAGVLKDLGFWWPRSRLKVPSAECGCCRRDIVVGQAERWERRQQGVAHELSSPIEGTGQKRGWQPGSKASTMIIRPPQREDVPLTVNVLRASARLLTRPVEITAKALPSKRIVRGFGSGPQSVTVTRPRRERCQDRRS